MPGKRAKELKDRTKEQATGTVQNTREVLGAFSFDKLLPPWVVETISYGWNVLARAAGRDNQAWGIFASLSLIVIGILTSWAGVGLVLIALGLFLLAFNILRLVPAVNSAVKGVGNRAGLYNDRDAPLWDRD